MNAPPRVVPSWSIQVAGRELSAQVQAALARAVVALDVELFGSCQLDFVDPQLELLVSETFLAGTSVQVKAGYGALRRSLFSGEVVALEPQFRRDRPATLRVVCYEPLHRLALVSRTRALLDADEKQLVEAVARENGLSGEAPRGTPGPVLQPGMSDALFLRRVANRAGQHLRMEGKRLVLGDPPRGEELTLGMADGMRRLHLRVKAAGQVGEVVVHGYDPVGKRPFQASARGEGHAGEASRTYGGSARREVAGDEAQPLDVATAERMARGRMRRLAEGAVTAELDLEGDPRAVPGAILQLGLRSGADGTYRVERARHQLSRQGYAMHLGAVRTARPKPPRQPAAQTAAPVSPFHVKVCVLHPSGGGPVEGERWELVEPGGRVVRRGTTGADGMVCESVPAAGDYRLRLLGPAPLASDQTGADGAEWEVPTGSIWATLLDEQGQRPLAGHDYAIHGDGVELAGTTDAQGRLRHDGLRPGDYQVEAAGGSAAVAALLGTPDAPEPVPLRHAAAPGPHDPPHAGC